MADRFYEMWTCCVMCFHFWTVPPTVDLLYYLLYFSSISGLKMNDSNLVDDCGQCVIIDLGAQICICWSSVECVHSQVVWRAVLSNLVRWRGARGKGENGILGEMRGKSRDEAGGLKRGLRVNDRSSYSITRHWEYEGNKAMQRQQEVWNQWQLWREAQLEIGPRSRGINNNKKQRELRHRKVSMETRSWVKTGAEEPTGFSKHPLA